MKTILTVLFLCSVAGSQVKTVQQSLTLKMGGTGKVTFNTFHYDEPQQIVITSEWCDLQPERKTRPNPYPSKHSATIFCENKHLMVMTADDAVIDLENVEAGAHSEATGKPDSEKPIIACLQNGKTWPARKDGTCYAADEPK